MAEEQTYTDDFAHLTMSEYIEETTRDQFFDKHTILGWMESKVQSKRLGGGASIVERINVDENDAGGSYAGTDVFSNSPRETLENAYYDFAQYEWPITATSQEVLRNRDSKAKHANLWMEKSDIAMKSLRKRLNTDAQLDGTGNGGKNMEGLALMVDSTTAYATLDRSVTTVWAAKETPVGGALVIDTPVGMLKMFNDISTGSGDDASVNVLLGTQHIVEEYEALLQGDQRYTGAMPAGDAGFGALSFKGKPFLWDRTSATGILYYLSNDTFRLLYEKSRDYFVTPIKSPENGTANSEVWLAHILLWLQLINIEPRRNGKLTGIV